TKQLGNVNTLNSSEMVELIKLKERFGFTDPRMDDAKRGAVSCAVSDFMSRVGGEVGTKGRMSMSSGGVGPIPSGSELRPATAVQANPLEQAIHSMAPKNYGEGDVEQLIQMITDQIMATAG